MKKLIYLLAVTLMVTGAFAQAPNKMSYQTVIRNSGGALLANQPVGMQISVLKDSATGTAVFVETQSVTTNANGLASLVIGGGTAVTGTLGGVNWAAGPYFIKTETDPAGGTTYSITGTSELLSVPYALSAGSFGETDPKVADTTVNSVAKWNGAQLVGGSLYDMDSVVGVGISSPPAIADLRMHIAKPGNNNNILLITGGESSGSTGGQLSLGEGIDGFLAMEFKLDGIWNRLNVQSRLGSTVTPMMSIGGYAGWNPGVSIGTTYYAQNPPTDGLLVEGNVGIGTATPAAKLDVAGSIKITDGSEGAGKVLTSDANGLATWAAPTQQAYLSVWHYGATAISIPNGTETFINFGSTRFNNNIGYSGGAVTVPYTGLYHFDLSIQFGYVYGNAYHVQERVYVNGNLYAQEFLDMYSNDIYLNANDVVTFGIFQDSGVAQNLGAFSRLTCHKVN